MLKRKIEKQMADWKSTSGHKPLIVKGCRQCGKTSHLTIWADKSNTTEQILFGGIGRGTRT